MYELERLVTILKPKQAFLDWLKQLPDQDDDVDLEELRSDCTALLLPPFESPDEAEDYLKEHIDDVFANECESWCESEEQWPADRTYEKLTEFFDIEFHSMVFDMLDDDMDDEDEDDDIYDEDILDEDDDFDDDFDDDDEDDVRH